MLIGELAEATGVSRRSLRYYEEVGLICSERTAGGWRRFPPDTVERVITVQHLLAAGLGSRTIVRILPCLRAGPEERTGYMERQLAAEIDRLEDRKRDLERELDVLRDLRREVTESSPSTERAGDPRVT